MNVPPPIPFRAAQAYGPSAPLRAPQTASTETAAPKGAPTPTDRTTLSTPTGPTRLSQLVAGTVRSDINHGHGFDGDPISQSSQITPPTGRPLRAPEAAGTPQPTDQDSFQLYSRTAERIEAATRRQVGSLIDLRG